jgi:L-lactate dehydrogenase complex protein LldG
MIDEVMENVRKALGHPGKTVAPPAPPVIDESFTRLVGAGDDLAGTFVRMCEENKMHVESVTAGELPSRLSEFLKSQNVKSAALSAGGVVERLGLAGSLRQAGLDARSWKDMTLDGVYDVDCGVTDVDYAVAETGTLAIRASAGHGRALSLVPALHVAVVEQSQILPDLIDLFAALGRDGMGSAVTLITGPSKTSDIEMNLVVGVHGPMQVRVFLVRSPQGI